MPYKFDTTFQITFKLQVTLETNTNVQLKKFFMLHQIVCNLNLHRELSQTDFEKSFYFNSLDLFSKL